MRAAPDSGLPGGLLVAWYGDDFTGSAAVMEVLSFAGLPSLLFLDIPTPEQLARFPGIRGFGIAGTARSQSPEWMEEHLPAVFRFLRSSGAAISHYKVCSTMDSSPQTGSIGRAIDIAQPLFEGAWVPLLFAAPQIRRYQSFGNLFAGAPDGVFRLDRHPIMTRHPTTPMKEADVRRHLREQTDRPISLFDLEMLATPEGEAGFSGTGGGILAIDTCCEADLRAAGRLIWENRSQCPLVAGSQGIEYALISHWQQAGQLCLPSEPDAGLEAEPIAVVSGSVSSVTAEQIDWAIQNGFTPVRFEATATLEGRDACAGEIQRALSKALETLEAGGDPIIFSARGPDDPAVAKFRKAAAHLKIETSDANRRLGQALGQMLDALVRQSGIRRAVITGGDSSGHAIQQLEIFALSALAPTVPGAALFMAHSENPRFGGLQLGLKGGQMGTPDYFGWIKQGGGAAGKRRLAA